MKRIMVLCLMRLCAVRSSAARREVSVSVSAMSQTAFLVLLYITVNRGQGS